MGGLLDSRWAFRLRKPKHRRCREILHEELSHILVLALQTSLYYAPIAFDGANIVTNISNRQIMAKREYIRANKDWLEAKAKEEGVKALPKGIYYKVLSEGNQSSPQPSVRSIITAHYTGKTIDGKQFDSSRGGVPLACRLCDLIEGWIIAIQQMHIGDKWELYIPAEMGYGKFSQPGIPGGSTLIFEVELLGIA